MFSTIRTFIDSHSLIPQGAHIIVGLSGGPDSVFLLHLLAGMRNEYNLTITAAHLDHQWRADSGKDVLFCQQLCDALTIPLIAKTADQLDYAPKKNGSQEAFGRSLRRHFFNTIKKTLHANLIALAHHAQDQQETFFIRLIRGSSLAGLVGIQPKNGPYIRPLLQTNKSDIINYLEKNNIAYLKDPSNQSDAYLRNRLRNNVLPALRTADKRFDHNFARTHHKLHETNMFLDDLAQTTLQKIRNDKKHISIHALLAQHVILRDRMIIQWLCNAGVPFIPSDGLIKEIVRFLQGPGGGSHTLYGSWEIVKKKGNAYIAKD